MKRLKALAVLLIFVVAVSHAQVSASPQFVMFILDEVRAELKLTPDQAKKIDEIMEPVVQKGPGGSKGVRLNRGDDVDSLDKRVLGVLNDKQRQRLRQIWIQRLGGIALSNASVAKDLALTADQKSKVSSYMADMNDEMKRIAMSSGDSRVRGTELRDATGKKMIALLSPQQLKKWAAVQGPKFEFKNK